MSIDGKTFRRAIREGRFGDDDSERVYKGSTAPINEASLSTFTQYIQERLEAPITDTKISDSKEYFAIHLVSIRELEQEDFSEEAPEVEETLTIHSFVEKSTGNVFLPDLKDESKPNIAYGARCNVSDPSSFVHAISSRGTMLPFQGGARILLELGVNVDSPNSWGETPLMYACSQVQTSTIEWLLSRKADPNKTTVGSKARALHKLVEGSGADDVKSKLIQVLANHGADVNAPNAWGITALHLASLLGLPECCKALLGLGASKIVKDDSNQTPKDLVKITELDSSSKRAEKEQVKVLLVA